MEKLYLYKKKNEQLPDNLSIGSTCIMFNNRTENRHSQYSVMPISVYPVRRNHNHGHTFQLCMLSMELLLVSQTNHV